MQVVVTSRRWTQVFCRMLLVGAPLALAACHSAASGGTYPDRPIQLIVPYGPGGGADTIARGFAQYVSTRYHQTVAVITKAGATGTIAANYVVQSKADGYTLFLNQDGPVTAMFTMANLPYRPLTDFSPIVLFGRAPIALLVRGDSQYRSLEDILAAARANPGRVNFGSPAVATPSHFTAALLERAAGVRMNHIPFKGPGDESTALLGGQIPMMFNTIPADIAFVRSGKMRALVVSGERRSAALPHVPTAAERGLAGVDAFSWYGLSAPKGVPRTVVDTLNREANEFIQSPEGIRLLDQLGVEEGRGGTPGQYQKFMEKQARLIEPVVKAEHITAD